jgi:hypothetical protein
MWLNISTLGLQQQPKAPLESKVPNKFHFAINAIKEK